MDLLERESALGALVGYAHEAAQGAGRLVLVSGEAGVGKSALVERLRADLPEARWWWGACDGLFTPRPLGPLFDIAGQLGGELAARCQARAARDDLFDALLRALDRPGDRQPQVLVLEDLHWADEATVDLVRFLARRIRAARLLMLVTYRDDELRAGGPLRVALGELARERPTRRVALAPLSARAVAVLAKGTGLDPVALHRLTGGNPFYVTEVVQAGTGGLPPSARDAALARAARLRPPARDLLDAAALAGARVEVALLERIGGYARAALDEVLASGLLTADGEATRGPALVRFRHEIARLAVERAVPAHRPPAVHAELLAGLRDLGCGDDARLAFHAEGAGDAAAVLRYAPAAGRRAAELASHREAAAQFERALRFAREVKEPATLAELHEDFAYEAALVDRWQDAADARQDALALWCALGDRRREGDTLRRLSRTLRRLCRGRDATAAAEAALAVLEPLGPGIELAWAYANLAGHRMFGGAHEDAVALARRAQAVAGPLGAYEVLADALDTEGCALAVTGDGTPQLRAALDIALAHGLEEHAGRAYANLYLILCAGHRFAEAERSFMDGLAYCEEHDISTFATCLRGERTAHLVKVGRCHEALALGDDLLHRDASPINRISPLIAVGRIRARRGEAEAARVHLNEALARADGADEPEYVIAVRLARAEASWLAGDGSRARHEAEAANDATASATAWERGAVAAWLRRTGSARPAPGDPAAPYRLELAGEPAAAARAWLDLGCPYDAALALHDADAEPALREALRILEDLDARATARLVRRRMRGLGIRSIPAGAQATTRRNPRGLTAREREVLDQLCAGHTNAEIAGRLFISAKTVNHHVSAVLAKLGTPTRRAAVAEATRLGLVGAPR